jgi:hypothetical protein
MRNTLPLFFLLLLFACQKQGSEVASLEHNHAETAAHHDAEAELAGLKKFEWQNEMCESWGYYDPGTYTEQQLRDTYFLWFQFNSVTSFESDVTLDHPELFTHAYISSTSQKLDADYKRTSEKLKTLDVIPIQPWFELQQLAIRHFDELYELKKLTIESHLDSTLLLNNPYTSPCSSYAEALAAADSTVLLDTWRQVVELMKSNNGIPENIERKYQAKLNSPERMLHARIDVMTFGWWNCANRQRKYIDGIHGGRNWEAEFIKLFVKTGNDCEDTCC